MTHEPWMRHALALAQRGTGRVSPNPRVGCVIVDQDRVLAEGWHDVYGGPHAERDALSKLNEPPTPSTTMYVTLEPCDHHGKRPPCTEAILASGIRKVVVGMQDPFPLVNGKGLARLRDHGIEVTVGVLEDECRWLNRWFIKHGTTGLPYVVLKLAQTVDGALAPVPSRRQQLTGPQTQRIVHALRAEVDAVMVGLRTVQTDDPMLTVRDVDGRDPIRIVVDPLADVAVKSRIVQSASQIRTIVVCSSRAEPQRLQQLTALGVELLPVSESGHQLDLTQALHDLGATGIASILCEGGAMLATHLLQSDLVDELRLHTAPTLIGPGLHLGPLPARKTMRLRSVDVVEGDALAVYLPVSA